MWTEVVDTKLLNIDTTSHLFIVGALQVSSEETVLEKGRINNIFKLIYLPRKEGNDISRHQILNSSVYPYTFPIIMLQFRAVVVGTDIAKSCSGQASFFALMASKLAEEDNCFVSVVIFCQFNSFPK